MIDTTLDQTEKLVLYGRSEGVTLDFKEAFPSADHKGTRDFLADVTAFDNTDGAISSSGCERTETEQPRSW